MAEIVMKVHSSGGKTVVALCDKSLLGKKIEEGSRQLDMSSSFYKGAVKSEKEILDRLSQECHVNATGKDAVEFCRKNKIVDKSSIIVIGGVPHTEAALVG